VTFLVNLVLMNFLTKAFVSLVRQAATGERLAKLSLGFFFAGLFIFPAAGAVLRRWEFNQHAGKRGPESGPASGCLFHPVWYFSLSLCIYVAAGSIFIEQLYGPEFNNASFFLAFVFSSLVLCGVQTFLVFRYFSAPRKPPRFSFLRSRASAKLGDLFIFLNMILFQILWNVFSETPFRRISGLEELGGRLFLLGFVALLLYFPPRIFYLASDINRPATWGTILLANSPIIVRALIGVR